jgi:hypothetical protein
MLEFCNCAMDGGAGFFSSPTFTSCAGRALGAEFFRCDHTASTPSEESEEYPGCFVALLVVIVALLAIFVASRELTLGAFVVGVGSAIFGNIYNILIKYLTSRKSDHRNVSRFVPEFKTLPRRL